MGCKFKYKGKTFNTQDQILSFIEANFDLVQEDYSAIKDYQEDIKSIPLEDEYISVSKINNKFNTGILQFDLKENNNEIVISKLESAINVNKIIDLIKDLNSIISNKATLGIEDNAEAIKVHYEFLKKKMLKSKKFIDAPYLAYMVGDKYASVAFKYMKDGVIEAGGVYAIPPSLPSKIQKDINTIDRGLQKNPLDDKLLLRKKTLERDMEILSDPNFSEKVVQAENNFINELALDNGVDLLENKVSTQIREDIENLFKFLDSYAHRNGINKVRIPSSNALDKANVHPKITEYLKSGKIDVVGEITNELKNKFPEEQNIGYVVEALTNPEWKEIVLLEVIEEMTDEFINGFKTEEVNRILSEQETGRSELLDNYYGEDKSTDIETSLFYLNEFVPSNMVFENKTENKKISPSIINTIKNSIVLSSENLPEINKICD